MTAEAARGSSRFWHLIMAILPASSAFLLRSHTLRTSRYLGGIGRAAASCSSKGTSSSTVLLVCGLRGSRLSHWSARSAATAEDLDGQGCGRKEGGGDAKYTVVFVRHGQSDFNKYDIFTGWCDVDLNLQGEEECRKAGMLLAQHGYEFDVAYSSVLKRATKSLWRLLEGCDHTFIPIRMSWRLNERHYGNLQGLSKQESERRLGPIVRQWRRSWRFNSTACAWSFRDAQPPDMDEVHPHWPLISQDRRYRDVPDIPRGESLEMCSVRVKQYWDTEIAPTVQQGLRVVIMAHANSLRALIKTIDNISKEDIEKLNVSNGVPLIYKFDSNMQAVGEPDEAGFRGRFLREDHTLARYQLQSERYRMLLSDASAQHAGQEKVLESSARNLHMDKHVMEKQTSYQKF